MICGGGAQGAAIAYRLAEAGWGEGVVMLEQVSTVPKCNGDQKMSKWGSKIGGWGEGIVMLEQVR